MSRFGRRPSPALIVACIALLIALSGTGYTAVVLPANSVGTKQLRANAVVAPKIKRGELRRVMRRDKIPVRGLPGARGAVGPMGPSGPPGAAGPQGPPGLSGREVVSNSKTDSETSKFVFAECPVTKNVIGGGFRVDSQTPLVENSIAVTRSEPAGNRWEANAHEHTSTASNWTLTTYALCAIVAP
jgi:hypothetical protein